jgi:hypothetical protein
VTTRASGDGVLGLITLRGKGCTIETEPATIRLLGAGGQVLPIHRSAGNPTNPAGSKRPDIAEYSGNVLMGFAWTGSYCGPSATSVQVSVATYTLRIPLRGAVPSCQKGQGSQGSELIPGVLKQAGAAVEPAPVAWGALRARVVLPATVGQAPIPLEVVLTNSSKNAVSLADPCPDYLTTASLSAGGAVSVYGGGGDLCGRALVVKPGVALVLKLGTLQFPAFSDLPRTKVTPGDPVEVTWEIAGVPMATATALIRS